MLYRSLDSQHPELLQSAEQEIGSARASHVLAEVSSSCMSLPWQAYILLHYSSLSLLVCCWKSFCLAVCCEFPVGFVWNKLSPFSLSDARHLLTASCHSATFYRRFSIWAHLPQAALLHVPDPGKRSRHFLQAEVCTVASLAASFGCSFQSSLWQQVQTSQLNLLQTISSFQRQKEIYRLFSIQVFISQTFYLVLHRSTKRKQSMFCIIFWGGSSHRKSDYLYR